MGKLDIELLFDQELESREVVYRFLARHIDSNLNEEIIQSLKRREEIAGIQIAEQVLLPHFESTFVSKSKIIILRLKRSIANWYREVRDIKLIICLVLKEDEDYMTKLEIKQFISNLADQEYIDKLLNDNKEQLYL